MHSTYICGWHIGGLTRIPWWCVGRYTIQAYSTIKTISPNIATWFNEGSTWFKHTYMVDFSAIGPAVLSKLIKNCQSTGYNCPEQLAFLPIWGIFKSNIYNNIRMQKGAMTYSIKWLQKNLRHFDETSFFEFSFTTPLIVLLKIVVLYYPQKLR